MSFHTSDIVRKCQTYLKVSLPTIQEHIMVYFHISHLISDLGHFSQYGQLSYCDPQGNQALQYSNHSFHFYLHEVAQGRPFGRPTCIPKKYIFYKKSFSQLSSDPTVAILCLNARFTCFWAALCATHIPRDDISSSIITLFLSDS